MSRRLVSLIALSLAVTVAAQAQMTRAATTQQQQPPKQQDPQRQQPPRQREARRGNGSVIAGALLEELLRAAAEEKAQRDAQNQDPLSSRRPSFPPPADPGTDQRWFESWETREDNLDTLGGSDDDIRWAIATLRSEAAFLQRHFARTEEALGEGYGAYYIELALFVTKTKDPRAIPALAVATDVAPAVATTLAEMGDPAVQPVLDTLTNPFLSESSAYTLGKFLQGNEEKRIHLSPANVARIRAALLSAAMSGKPSLQKSAIRAFRNVAPTEKERIVMTRLASNERLRGEVEKLFDAWR